MSVALKISNTKDHIIGKFKNDIEYLNAVKTLINSSSETINRINFFKEKILNKNKFNTALDIGIGNGELSEALYKNLNTIHLVDPSLHALNSINEDNYPHKELKKYNLKIENFDFPSNFYDLVINCHTLYHLSRQEWKKIIERSFKALKMGGRQIIVLNNGLGRSKLTNMLGANNIIDIESLIEECVSITNCSIEIYPSYEKVKTQNLEEMLSIIGVFLQDVNLIYYREKIIDYLYTYCYKKHSFFIDYCQYFFILNKKIEHT